MSEKQYTTDELVRLLEEFGNKPVPLFNRETEAIIARLRKADKLCEAAKAIRGEPFAGYDSRLVDELLLFSLSKAIAEYEEGK